jgi:hypothetical protein
MRCICLVVWLSYVYRIMLDHHIQRLPCCAVLGSRCRSIWQQERRGCWCSVSFLGARCWAGGMGGALPPCGHHPCHSQHQQHQCTTGGWHCKRPLLCHCHHRCCQQRHRHCRPLPSAVTIAAAAANVTDWFSACVVQYSTVLLQKLVFKCSISLHNKLSNCILL